MDNFDNNQCCICLIISGVIFLIIIISSCWDTVEPTEYGLKCSSISKTCNKDEVFEAGRHLVWPTNYFIRFPGSLQTIIFSDYTTNPPLKSRTAEGLSLGLSISFQYQLIKNDIPDLYSMNNLEYEATFIRIARDTILQAAGRYDAPSYWTNRTKIGKDMRQELDNELQKAHARCIFLQILRIDLPDNYEDSIVITQVEVQNKKMKQFEQEAAMILQQISVLKSETEMKIKAINAQAQADAYSIKQKAMAESNKLTIDAESEAYKNAKDQTQLTDEELNDYIYYLSLMEKNNTKLLVGMDSVIADARRMG